MAAMNMNQEQFKQLIREEKPVLVDFWAPWCSYCRRIDPAYEKIGEEYADSLAVGKINIDEEPQLASRGDQGHPNSGAVPERKGRGFHHRARLKGRDRPFHSGSLGEITEGSDMNNNHVYDMIVVGGDRAATPPPCTRHGRGWTPSCWKNCPPVGRWPDRTD